MRDILSTLDRWIAEPRRFATATVVRTWGSSPRPVGSVMGIAEDGSVVGSVSGGCVESAVVDGAQKALADGQPRRMSFASVDEQTLWEVGLSCGGSIEVWIEPEPYRDPTWRSAVQSVRDNAPAIFVTRYDPLEHWLWTESARPGPSELAASLEPSPGGRQSREVEAEGGRYFLQVLPSCDRLLILGASHIAVSLVQLAKTLGFETVVIDPRARLLASDRFPEAPDRVIQGWPQDVLPEMRIDASTYAVVLSHDPKIDDAALEVLLRSPAAYIGALGSRATQDKRHAALSALGFAASELTRIHGPVGLDIGAKAPEEIALSILAEIVKVRRAT